MAFEKRGRAGPGCQCSPNAHTLSDVTRCHSDFANECSHLLQKTRHADAITRLFWRTTSHADGAAPFIGSCKVRKPSNHG
jgi:hypothetical protein